MVGCFLFPLQLEKCRIYSCIPANPCARSIQSFRGYSGCIRGRDSISSQLSCIGRSFMLGFGGLVVGWLVGSFFVPVVPTALLPPNWSLEIITALVSYVFMWVACTFLK
ncbi:hypothetical protein GOP47_0010480 [Adiantum capillus-veneris]|uniref:Uncharacterized protein n=1 Tax=Adiantum capillus-veneris TaxID=13818 RepID=A0A9D4UVE0_ADICA|nr:hypothetical protein GOP47_0010480 [Adiantum capillus-veneris]